MTLSFRKAPREPIARDLKAVMPDYSNVAFPTYFDAIISVQRELIVVYFRATVGHENPLSGLLSEEILLLSSEFDPHQCMRSDEPGRAQGKDLSSSGGGIAIRGSSSG